MTLLDTIKQMQQQGVQEPAIIQSLREQGYTPKEINDAINQSRIKAAIGAPGDETIEEMQPSIMSDQQPTQEQLTEQPTPEYIYQTPQAYPPGYEYQPQPAVSTETITEITEQLVIEKLSEIKKVISTLNEFRTLIEAKVSGVDERLKRIESTIEKLQLAILGKIGDYGQSIQDIKSELGMMQESFSKVVAPLVNKVSEQKEKRLEKEESNESKEKPRRKAKAEPSFEDYLRA